jgi:hypothetical protein
MNEKREREYLRLLEEKEQKNNVWVVYDLLELCIQKSI